jgi:hypothetical protein
MRLIVTGGRDYGDKSCVFWHLERASDYYGDIVVIQGGARGADAHAREWASRSGHMCLTYDAPWLFARDEAGKIRNRWMLDDSRAEIVLAFPGGYGTAHMTRICAEAGLPVYYCYRG